MFNILRCETTINERENLANGYCEVNDARQVRMSSVAERGLTLTDEQIDQLVQVPEIQEALNRYAELQQEFRHRLLDRITRAPADTLPDVSDISADLNAALDGQQDTIRRLARQHLVQFQWTMK